MDTTSTEAGAYADLKDLESKYKNMSKDQLATEAVNIATRQIMASSEFKKPRLAKLARYWELYDGKVSKKLRQLFNVPIPVFPGMIDTLNAQYDTPIQMKFKEGDAADYFKVQKINGAFQMEIMNTTNNSKWDSKLRIARQHAIMNGRAVLEYMATSDPEYSSELNVINLKHFNFQPRGGQFLENHLFAGTEDVEKTKDELRMGAAAGTYDKAQVTKLFQICDRTDYLPDDNHEMGQRLSRFKPLGLDPENNSYVGQSVYKLANHILHIDGERYYLSFHPWSKTWLRFEKWTDICSDGLYPWVTYATHPDDENFLSKSYGDDIYAASDAIVAMFNQELTNREKRNFGARAYDKDMFTDVRKLDESMHRPDALVPADTKGGTRRISEGIFEFKVGELNGTVSLIDWITGSLGRNTGANDLAMGNTQDPNKKASVTFAEQKSISKRLSWGSQPFQEMMGDLGKLYITGLKDHMPASMAIRLMGEGGWDWSEIARLDLNTKKDVDVLIESTDNQMQESDSKAAKREKVLSEIGTDPILAGATNPKWRIQELLKIGQYEDSDIASALDTKTFYNKKAIAKAAEAIQLILRGQKPQLWYGANIAFIQKIVDTASDKRSTLGDKFKTLMDYAMAHKTIAQQNIDRSIAEGVDPMNQTPLQPQGAPTLPAPGPQNPGIPGGISKAMSVANAS